MDWNSWVKRLHRALPAIKDLMYDTSKSCMPKAAYTYYVLSGDVTKPMEVLSATVKSPTYDVESIDLLARMAPASKSAIPLIGEKLDAEEEAVREAAVIALGKFGSDSKDYLPSIRKLAANDPDVLVRKHAELAIQKIIKQ
ncbi:MAG: HEAT repeat domain-containing protein [Pirellulaceae bacterium]